MNHINNELQEIYRATKDINDGELAGYIPELANISPELYAINITTINGETFQVGNVDTKFSLQSVSKPFLYGLAVSKFGAEFIHSKVGVEPSGEAFNSIIELEKKTHRPFNPMINSGAIAISNFIKDESNKTRLDIVLNFFSDLTSQEVSVDQKIFESEKKTAHRNRAIAHLLRHFDVIDDEIDQTLDLYFQQCSILTNINGLGMMAATLANDGVNPKSNKRIFSSEITRKTLGLMLSCGMYDSAGKWIYEIGLPAKSGVSGALITIVPGKMGIATYSPKIDSHGHSVRSLNAIKLIKSKLNLNLF